MNRYLVSLACSAFLLMTACASKSSNEMEAISESVMKHKEGIDIQFKPLQEDKGIDLVNKKF